MRARSRKPRQKSGFQSASPTGVREDARASARSAASRAFQSASPTGVREDKKAGLFLSLLLRFNPLPQPELGKIPKPSSLSSFEF